MFFARVPNLLFLDFCVLIQNNLWRPTVKKSTTHKDGAVTVFYEVPAGYNEKLQLFKRITRAVRP